jgi:hypothetical protein
MNRVVAASLALIVSTIAWSQAAPDRPALNAGDSWTYRVTNERAPSVWNQTHEDSTVTRVSAGAIFLSTRTSGSTQPPRDVIMGGDWSRVRDVNGQQTVVNRPFAFPLSQGKKWDVEYTEDNPNKQHKSETFETHYSVVGYETVEVPAGKFNALKIEADGVWHAQIAPQQNVVQAAQSGQDQTTLLTSVGKTSERTASGRLYKAFWYVPEVKRWVKAVEEYYGSNGVRNERTTLELESFKPAGSNEPASSAPAAVSPP